MNMHIPAIEAMIAARPVPCEQIIVAGADEDVTARDLLDWIEPVLQAIPNGRWASCEIEFGPGDVVFARHRCGTCAAELSLHADWTPEETRQIAGAFPGGGALVIVSLSDYTSQVLSLMDGIARWFNVYPKDSPQLAPILRLLELVSGLRRMLG